MSVENIVIIGGGVAGLTAAIYAARGGLNPILIQGGYAGASQMPGGQLLITSLVENYPGFPDGVQGPELVENMLAQAVKFGTRTVDEFVKRISHKSSDVFEIEIENGDNILTSSIIVATGAKARWLGAPGEEDFMNKGLSACMVCDIPMPMFRDKPIVVLGGGDSACEESMHGVKFGSMIYMVVRKDFLRASDIMKKRVLSNPKIKILFNTVITGYVGDSSGNLAGVKLSNSVTNDESTLDARGVFMAIGHDPATSFLKADGGVDVKLDDDGYVIVSGVSGVETSVKGIFAAGDVHDRIFRQAITAAGFGCGAALEAEKYLAEKTDNVVPENQDSHSLRLTL